MLNGRPTMDQVFMEFALIVARRSVCLRRTQVGAVVTNWDKTNVLAIGYNGPARGLAHDCTPNPAISFSTDLAGVHEIDQLIGRELSATVKPGSCTCVHAEVNALLKAPYDALMKMYTTHSPCPGCARLILNSQVKEVIYNTQYRLVEGLYILAQGGVKFRHIDEDPQNLEPFTFPNGEVHARG